MSMGGRPHREVAVLGLKQGFSAKKSADIALGRCVASVSVVKDIRAQLSISSSKSFYSL